MPWFAVSEVGKSKPCVERPTGIVCESDGPVTRFVSGGSVIVEADSTAEAVTEAAVSKPGEYIAFEVSFHDAYVVVD